jgi:hypothetical protein
MTYEELITFTGPQPLWTVSKLAEPRWTAKTGQ